MGKAKRWSRGKWAVAVVYLAILAFGIASLFPLVRVVERLSSSGTDGE